MKKLITISMLVVVLLTACGPKATPTMNPADVQATAFAAASTMVALTQAAIPTATPVPPTETSVPSPTLAPTLPLQPTSSIPTLFPTSTPNTGADNCVHTLSMGDAGPGHKTLIKNQSGGTINLSLNLYAPNAFGQCGSISFANIAKNGSVSVDLPSGYWYAYAWVTVKGGQSTSSGSFYVQPAQFDKIELCVRKDVIVYKPGC